MNMNQLAFCYFIFRMPPKDKSPTSLHRITDLTF